MFSKSLGLSDIYLLPKIKFQLMIFINRINISGFHAGVWKSSWFDCMKISTYLSFVISCIYVILPEPKNISLTLHNQFSGKK